MNSAGAVPDIFFAPTPPRVIAEMFRLAEVGTDDVLFDLGCGDGRIVISAATECGARAVGIDIDPLRIHEAKALAAASGVEERVEFRIEDLFATDIRGATVIALYLLDSLNVRLRPKILAECRPGTRVLSYSFEMGDWEPDAHTPIAANGVSLWHVPADVSGTWKFEESPTGVPITVLHLSQRFQAISGSVIVDGKLLSIRDGRVRGRRFSVTLAAEGAAQAVTFSGVVEGNMMRSLSPAEAAAESADSSVAEDRWMASRVELE